MKLNYNKSFHRTIKEKIINNFFLGRVKTNWTVRSSARVVAHECPSAVLQTKWATMLASSVFEIILAIIASIAVVLYSGSNGYILR